MCNLEQWTFVDGNGNRHPRERLYPCNRTTAAHTPCNNVRVYTLNDEVAPPAPVTIQPILKKKGKKIDMKDGVSLEWEFKTPWSKGKDKKKTPSPPIPTTPNSMLRPGQVALTQPLPITAPVQQQMLPSMPVEPIYVPISPHHTPPRTPASPRVTIIQPTREHRPGVIIEPARSRSQRYRTRYREHERPLPARHSPRHSREEKREDRRPRSPSPATVLRRQRREEAYARQEARIDAEIRRLNDLAERRRIERQVAAATARNAIRDEELVRLDRQLEDLRAEVQEQHKARQRVRVVVHQDPFEYDLIRDALPRERSRSSSRGRGTRRVLEPLRRRSRSADRGRGPRYIEAAPTEYDYIPIRRNRTMSEVGPRPRVREYVRLYDDEEDRRYRQRRWF